MNTALKLFSDPHLLRQVDRPLLAELFDRFTPVLPSKYFLPNPRADNDAYFDSLANVLERTGELPATLLQALLEIEALAASENLPRLQAALGSDFENTDGGPLSHPIQAWLRSCPGPISACQHVSVSDFSEESPLTEAAPSSPLPAPSSASAYQDVSVSAFPSDSTEAPPSGMSAFQDVSVSAFPSAHLLDNLAKLLARFVILPKYAAEAIALWILHTYAFHLRDVTAYIGIESPEKRCGKTTLLSILNELCNRAIAAANISPPAFFRVIEDMAPTLLIDEVDTFLNSNDQLRGILNAGYNKKTAFVLRAAAAAGSPSPPWEEREGERRLLQKPTIEAHKEGELSLSENSASERTEPQNSPAEAIKRYSCWCPKALAKIGHFPDTLADRCIIIRMQRKSSREQCDRFRNFDPVGLKEQCARFVEEHSQAIASAKPSIPPELNDRAADIWEPLLVLADIAGGHWPEMARKAAIHLSSNPQETSPITSLLLDMFLALSGKEGKPVPTNAVIPFLLSCGDRPWNEGKKQKDLTHAWLAKQLRPYGAHSKNIRIGDTVVKGYAFGDLLDAFRRYLPKSVIQAYVDEQRALHNEGNTEKPGDPS